MHRMQWKAAGASMEAHAWPCTQAGQPDITVELAPLQAAGAMPEANQLALVLESARLP